MRYTKVCGPRPSGPLLRWPLAEFADPVWDWTSGFPVDTRAVVRAGWADVGPEPQWLEPGQRVVNGCLVEGLAVC